MKLKLVPIFLANIFLSLHYAAVLYVNSTFLGQFFSPAGVSLLFILGAVLNILLFLIVQRIFRTLGVKFSYLLFTLITGVSLALFAFTEIPLYAGIFFVIYAAFQFMVYYCLDIFLEDLSKDKITGGIRGLYLTLSSAAIAVGPILLAIFANGEELRPIYTLAITLLAIPFFLGLYYFKFKRSSINQAAGKLILPFKSWRRTKNVYRATLARLVLEIFYALMIIYTPLYLHEKLGFEWSELGIIFAIMLLPFIIFEWPLGILADKKFGEKEVMSIGFFIAGTALLFMPFLSKGFIIWTVVLFASRIGASFIEIMTESYFFKHVDVRDTGLISIFRLTRPAGLIIGSFLGVLTLIFLPFQAIFFVIAVVVFLGLKQSVNLKDTL
ncbi:MAG: MFS transporter [bacterium]|nr:MFS transporter [bacterium]